MKRTTLIILALTILTLLLASCARSGLADMEYIIHEDGSYGSQIKWGDTVYTFWGAADTDLIDTQIGIIGGDKRDKVYSLKGYAPEEWIIQHLDIIMSTYDIYKADSVTDIPEEFEPLKNE